ncbi:MAG: hypothetical protein KZQ96_23410 [Candidatus Thiodiazotropha sp. (ex Lucinoma borealis)]|nr:hypothetical protein [Candidatus Thiodiazotropha sp. (ex Lucinoma borealis)]
MNTRLIVNKKYYLGILFTAFSFFSDMSIADDNTRNGETAKTHKLAVALAEYGSFSCVSRANQIANFLGNVQGDIILFNIPVNAPDHRLLHATLIISSDKKEQEYTVAEITMAPNQVNGCGAVYQESSYVQKKCKNAILEEYPNYKSSPIEKTNLLLLPLNRTAKVIARPIGKGCLLTKYEVVQ